MLVWSERCRDTVRPVTLCYPAQLAVSGPVVPGCVCPASQSWVLCACLAGTLGSISWWWGWPALASSGQQIIWVLVEPVLRAVREKPGEWQHCSDHSVTMLGVIVLPGPAQECYSESNRKYLQTNTSTKYSHIGSLISSIAREKIIKMWLQLGFVNKTLNGPNVLYKTGSTKPDCTLIIGAWMGGWHFKREMNKQNNLVRSWTYHISSGFSWITRHRQSTSFIYKYFYNI